MPRTVELESLGPVLKPYNPGHLRWETVEIPNPEARRTLALEPRNTQHVSTPKSETPNAEEVFWSWDLGFRV